MKVEFGGYRVRPFNELCWCIDARRADTGEWESLGRYYPTLLSALEYAMEHGYNNAVEGEYGLEEAVREMRRIAADVERAVAAAGKESS